MILQWRRGVRGLEYNTLYVMAKEVAEADNSATVRQSDSPTFYRTTVARSSVSSLKPKDSSIFKEKALRLLMLEGREIKEGIKIDSYSIGEHLEPEIQILRKELFGDSKSHGGLFKEILDIIDVILYDSLNNATLGS